MTCAVNRFFKILLEGLCELQQCFPTCLKTQSIIIHLQEINDDIVKTEFVKSWYTIMKPFFKDCFEQNEINLFQNLNPRLIDIIEINKKWHCSGFNEHNKTAFWAFTHHLNFLS